MNLKEQLDDVIRNIEPVYYDMFVSSLFMVQEKVYQ